MILNILKKIIRGLVILYSFNLIAVKFGMVIPINLFTIGIVSFLDFLGIFLIVLLKSFIL